MKKAFISVPMRGRTKENIEKSIEKMKKVAQVYSDEELEFVNTTVQEQPPYELDEEHNSIWYLGKSLEILSQCDVLVTVNDGYKYSGCYIEQRVAECYSLEIIRLNESLKYICPDIAKNHGRLWDEEV